MPKNKPCKGLRKRVRFTKSGKVKFRRAFGRHRRSHKSGKLRRSYRLNVYAKSCDLQRIRSMLCTSVRSAESAAVTEADKGGDQAAATAGE